MHPVCPAGHILSTTDGVILGGGFVAQDRNSFRRFPPAFGTAKAKAALFRLFPEVAHIPFYSYHIGNYPTLNTPHIEHLCAVINSLG